MTPEPDPLIENYRNAWKGLQMIREAVETLGPPGILPSQEAVITLDGPEPIHEAQAIVDALTKILNAPKAETEGLRAAIRPFTFPAYPKSFQRSDEEMTEVLVCDYQVRDAREAYRRREPPSNS